MGSIKTASLAVDKYSIFNSGLSVRGSVSAKGLKADRVGINGALQVKGSVRFNDLTGGTLTTDANGNVSVSSDERLKHIQGEFTSGLSAILALKPIHYKWNDISGLDQEHVYTGFSAQNVQSVLPEAVGVDERGYLTLNDRPIIGALVNAIKSLSAKNEMLEKENNSLKAALEGWFDE